MTTTAGRLLGGFLAAAILLIVVALMASASPEANSNDARDPFSGPYPGTGIVPEGPVSLGEAVAVTPAPVIATPTLAATPEPTPAPEPLVAGAVATPAPAQPAQAAEVTASSPAHAACGAYPVLLEPAPGLEAATGTAIEMWNAYDVCEHFAIGAGGISISYASVWPGDCVDPDIAACTLTGIFINPYEPKYHAASVIAHELGHVLNFSHSGGPAIMDPGNWAGPATVWCSVEVRCQ